MTYRLNETTLTDLVSRLSPWLAPVPTAFLVFRATINYLGWPWPIAIIAAAILEALGLSAANTALEFREHNRGLKPGDRRTAPLWLALAVMIGYLVAAVTLTVLLDVVSGLARYAPAIFPLFSVGGVTILAVRSDHRKRREEMVLSLAPPYNKKQHRIEQMLIRREMGEDVELPGEKRARLAAADLPVAIAPPPAIITAEIVQMRTATMQDWRAIMAQCQPGDTRVGIDGVKTLLEDARLAAPSQRTLYNWARMARNGNDGHDG